MSAGLFTEVLNRFKQNEKPEVVLLLDNNPELVKIVVAWTNINIKPIRNLTGSPDNCEVESWDWLWENVAYSLKELKEKTGTPISEKALGDKLKPVIGNRIIYPDGTVNPYVERYLRDRVIKLFESK
jgi:hypothetical protein